MLAPDAVSVVRSKRLCATVLLGDARERLKDIPAGAVDAVICDPIYPEVDRNFGRISVRDWKFMMVDVVREVRRILKPTGSAMFVIQPNSEHIGRMRPWAFEFMAWLAKDWNLIQDVWWWNYAAMPTLHTSRAYGLMRPSIKACVWVGARDCYRNQDEVLWERAESTATDKRINRSQVDYKPSGHHQRQGRALQTSLVRGGSTPYNVIPCANTDNTNSSGAKGHGAGTPYKLADWWVRYICPPNGIVVDPFCGAGTIGEAALAAKRRFIGIDIDPTFVEIASATCVRTGTKGKADERVGSDDRSDSEDCVQHEVGDLSESALGAELGTVGEAEFGASAGVDSGRVDDPATLEG